MLTGLKGGSFLKETLSCMQRCHGMESGSFLPSYEAISFAVKSIANKLNWTQVDIYVGVLEFGKSGNEGSSGNNSSTNCVVQESSLDSGRIPPNNISSRNSNNNSNRNTKEISSNTEVDINSGNSNSNSSRNKNINSGNSNSNSSRNKNSSSNSNSNSYMNNDDLENTNSSSNSKSTSTNINSSRNS
uniref:Uncharacterized protein n=1 Tax=Glossina palpalis gambiensis TaxID=67801 RepID=A0A1B0BM33_9MUSC